MKKLVLLLILLISFDYSFCNDKEDKGWHLPNGFRLGYQWSNQINNETWDGDNLDKFYVGYVRKLFKIPFFKFESGLEYMMAGSKHKNDSVHQIHYIVLPAQLVGKLGPIVLQGGLSANFKVVEDLIYDDLNLEVPESEKSTFMDVAANLGAGFNIAFITLEGRYYWGLTDINNGWHNRYIQIGLKFHF